MEKSLHEGHRARLRAAAENDSELSSFSQFQMLEYVLTFVIPRKDTNPIAHALIDEFGSLFGVLTARPDELYKVPGMTQNAAYLLACMFAVTRQAEITRYEAKPRVSRIDEAVRLLKPYFSGRGEERIYCAFMDINDRLIQVVKVGEGIADFTVVQYNRILAIAGRNMAKKVVIAHNHPAGFAQPSDQDYSATNSLYMVLQSIDATLADHLIFADGKYFSFYENGLLDSIMQNSDKIYGKNVYEETRACRTSGRYITVHKK